MKTKADGIPKAFEHYKQQEIDLILALTPTRMNVKNLATSLGRTKDAIYTIYHLAYSGKWLKQSIKGCTDNADNVVTKIAKTKEKYGIFIGHEIKK